MKYAIAILAICSLVSCKKEYNCRCVDKDNNEAYSINYKFVKKDFDSFKKMCDGNVAGANQQLAPYSCTLK